MAIDTGDSEPVSQKPDPIVMNCYKWVKDRINKLLSAKVIRGGWSSWSAPIIVVPKGNGGKHLDIDYCALDKMTWKFIWPNAKGRRQFFPTTWYKIIFNLGSMSRVSPEFRVWQHLEDHWNKTQLHKLAHVPTVPVSHLWKHMINNNGPILPFNLADESIDDTASIWTLFSCTSIYVIAIGLLIPTGLGIFCCYIFWCQHAILVCWPFQSGSLWHTIVDDDEEAAPIYRGDGKAGQPVISPHKNHNLHMKWEPTWMESQQKQQAPSKAVPQLEHWIQIPKSRECNEHTWFVVRLRLGPATPSLKEMTYLQLKDNCHLILQSKHVHS